MYFSILSKLIIQFDTQLFAFFSEFPIFVLQFTKAPSY